jgi:hypothetical protein
MYKQSSLLFICKVLVRVGGFGLLFKIMNWPFDNELMCFGFVGAGIFFILLMIEKRKDKKKENGNL